MYEQYRSNDEGIPANVLIALIFNARIGLIADGFVFLSELSSMFALPTTEVNMENILLHLVMDQ